MLVIQDAMLDRWGEKIILGEGLVDFSLCHSLCDLFLWSKYYHIHQSLLLSKPTQKERISRHSGYNSLSAKFLTIKGACYKKVHMF